MIDLFDGEYRFLSNFWPCPIVMGDFVFPSTENAYQAAKYPKSERQQFTTCSPAMAKKLGSRIDRPKNWDAEKLIVMRKVLERKFAPKSYNLLQLSLTSPHELIEGNTWGDVFWGVCDGIGENNLGKMLMDIRSELSNSEIEN